MKRHLMSIYTIIKDKLFIAFIVLKERNENKNGDETHIHVQKKIIINIHNLGISKINKTTTAPYFFSSRTDLHKSNNIKFTFGNKDQKPVCRMHVIYFIHVTACKIIIFFKSDRPKALPMCLFIYILSYCEFYERNNIYNK